MNKKKAKSIIRKMIKNNNLQSDEIEALEISKIALEKQITESVIWKVEAFQCPTCGEYDKEVRNFCSYCGQKLKYS